VRARGELHVIAQLELHVGLGVHRRGRGQIDGHPRIDAGDLDAGVERHGGAHGEAAARGDGPAALEAQARLDVDVRQIALGLHRRRHGHAQRQIGRRPRHQRGDHLRRRVRDLHLGRHVYALERGLRGEIEIPEPAFEARVHARVAAAPVQVEARVAGERLRHRRAPGEVRGRHVDGEAVGAHLQPAGGVRELGVDQRRRREPAVRPHVIDLHALQREPHLAPALRRGRGGGRARHEDVGDGHPALALLQRHVGVREPHQRDGHAQIAAAEQAAQHGGRVEPSVQPVGADDAIAVRIVGLGPADGEAAQAQPIDLADDELALKGVAEDLVGDRAHGASHGRHVEMERHRDRECGHEHRREPDRRPQDAQRPAKSAGRRRGQSLCTLGHQRMVLSL
jgi:hypothetical protein